MNISLKQLTVYLSLVAIGGGAGLLGSRYLLPVHRSFPTLRFVDVHWGTDKVLRQTVNMAEKINLAVGYLPTLADIDRPQDLPIWEEIRQGNQI